MTMTPINRIPLEADSPPLHAIVRGELDSRGNRQTAGELQSAIDHCVEETHISCMMDWAMQIRMELGISWGECIDAAMILYYG
jgi:hypothetical protein